MALAERFVMANVIDYNRPMVFGIIRRTSLLIVIAVERRLSSFLAMTG